MKIEIVSSTTFDDIKEGECFRMKGGSYLYMRIEVDHDLTFVPDEELEGDRLYGLAVNLENGSVTWFNKTDSVERVNAKVSY